MWGDLLLLGAVASWGGYITVNKPLVARYGSLTVLAGTFLAGSADGVAAGLAVDGIAAAAGERVATARGWGWCIWR